MVSEKDQFYDLLPLVTASMHAQAEFLKKIPPTEENIELLNTPSEHLPNNMSLLELILNNSEKCLELIIDQLQIDREGSPEASAEG